MALLWLSLRIPSREPRYCIAHCQSGQPSYWWVLGSSLWRLHHQNHHIFCYIEEKRHLMTIQTTTQRFLWHLSPAIRLWYVHIWIRQVNEHTLFVIGLCFSRHSKAKEKTVSKGFCSIFARSFQFKGNIRILSYNVLLMLCCKN